ncbi:MAG: OsmC family protein [Candidatus Sigynarchaeum springense]
MTARDQGSTVQVEVNWEKDLIFKVDFDGLKVPKIHVDETNKDEAEMVGVTPARLLASAVGSCLASSLAFCMSKRDVQVESLIAKARATTGRDQDGRLRVQEIAVDLFPKTTNPAAIKRLGECKKVFEKFCTVTESVRKGIKVIVNVHDS